jgi:hypothetical protein
MEPRTTIQTRIPFDAKYTGLLGQALYFFSYYEWTVIYIIERIEPGFVHEYSRGKPPWTSGSLKNKFKEVIRNFPRNFDQSLKDDIPRIIQSTLQTQRLLNPLATHLPDMRNPGREEL